MARLNYTIGKSMYYGAEPYLFERAKKMRHQSTQAELKLWEILKNRKMLGLHFRRQQPIDMFIADFYCHKLKLVVEVDGEVHDSDDRKEYDLNRTAEMKRFGIEVVRFTNKQVLENLQEVKTMIEAKCMALHPPAL